MEFKTGRGVDARSQKWGGGMVTHTQKWCVGGGAFSAKGHEILHHHPLVYFLAPSLQENATCVTQVIRIKILFM